MIICPNCKEEIEDDSHYCDQCGQPLSFCERCGRVGMGRRCTSCGGLMLSAEDYHQRANSQAMFTSSVSVGLMSQVTGGVSVGRMPVGVSLDPMPGVSRLLLFNDSLGIRIIGQDGVVIGRREGPYAQMFQSQKFVSGVHAMLKYKPKVGWCVIDCHSSNGTRLNNHQLQPDVEMSLRDGDVLMLANVSLQVSVN